MNRDVEVRGAVALLGYPNVGKSTLLNHLAGKKIAATSHKAQTTRSVLYHVLPQEDGNLVFIDTPGLFATGVSRALYQSAWGAVQDADILLLLCDGRLRTPDHVILEKLKHWEKPIAIAINKIDAAKEELVFAQTEAWRKILPQAEIFQISAKRGLGVDYLLRELSKFFPDKRTLSLAELDDSHQASEITREKVLLYIHQELPWQAVVQTKKIERQKQALKIQQTIHVPAERHRAIFIGKGGEKLKTIGTAARLDMATYFNKKVHLFIRIEVKNDGVA